MKKNYLTLGLIILLLIYLFVGYKQGLGNIFLALAAFLGIVVLVISLVKTSRKKETTTVVPPRLTKEKENHYVSEGLSDDDIEFFRETMAQTKESILHLEKNIKSSPKLTAVDLRNHTLKAAKDIFKQLVAEPKKLHQANHFLYTHLPNLVDLTDKYLEINAYSIKNKDTYDTLLETAQIIEQMSQLVLKDYQLLQAEDLEELDLEMSIAKNSLNKDNENNKSEEE